MIGNLVKKRPLTNTGKGLTQAHFADECNIKKMMARATQGIPPMVSSRRPMFGDFSKITDYQSALIQIQNARDAFMELPSQLRKALKNDPAELLRVLDDPDKSRAIELGLLEKPASQRPPEAAGKGDSGNAGESPKEKENSQPVGGEAQ